MKNLFQQNNKSYLAKIMKVAKPFEVSKMHDVAFQLPCMLNSLKIDNLI